MGVQGEVAQVKCTVRYFFHSHSLRNPTQKAKRRKLAEGMKQAIDDKWEESLEQVQGKQREVLLRVRKGQSVFFTGPAGCGKSFLLKHLVKLLPSDSTHATSSTGITALHISGCTIFHWAGIGVSAEPTAEVRPQATPS